MPHPYCFLPPPAGRSKAFDVQMLLDGAPGTKRYEEFEDHKYFLLTSSAGDRVSMRTTGDFNSFCVVSTSSTNI